MPARTNQTSNYLSRSQTALFGRRQGLKAKLHKKIHERRAGGKKVMKTGKPVDVHLEHEAECAICLDVIDPKNSACTPCGHTFCFSCIAKNMERSSACPMCRTELQTKSEPPRMKIDDIRLIVAHNLNAVRSDIMHIMRNEALSDDGNSQHSSSQHSSSQHSSPQHSSPQPTPAVSAAPSTAVSEAGDTEQPSAVPDGGDTDEHQSIISAFGIHNDFIDADSDDDDDDSDDGSSGMDEYTNEDYDSDSFDDPLEQHYVEAVHALNFRNNYNHRNLTERERNVFEATAHLMLCCANDVSRWYNDANHPSN